MSLCIGLASANTDMEVLASVGYEIVDNGYLALPKQAKNGIVATDSRHSQIYLLQNNNLETLLSSPGCGRYTNLNADKTLLGFKHINEYAEQAPALLDLATGKVTLLEDYSNQCGQVSFSNDGTMAYTVENTLIINRNGIKTTYDLGYYTNIVNLSPDGMSVAFSDPDGKPVLMQLVDGIQQRLSDVNDVYNPQWSPDGKKIVYEQSNMSLYVYDKTLRKFDYLTKGSAAQWLSDSENLVFTTAEYENDDVFQYKGSSVHQMSYDGKVKRVLVATSKEVPQEVGVLDGDRLAIAYSSGNRRIAAISLGTPAMRKVSSAVPQSTQEEVLFAAPIGKKFGKVFAEFKIDDKLVGVRKAADAAKQTNALINAGVLPYINQTWDAPTSYDGCYGYGPSACAPSTACILLGHYGLIPEKATSSRRPSGNWKVVYAHYIGIQYTSPQTGHVFSDAAKGNGCYAKGGYGYMWNSKNGSSGSPRTSMAGFYKNNGIASAAFDYNGLSKIRTECNAGYPYSWCITSTRSNGHLILPYRADAIYSGGKFVTKNGSVVCQDPYGNANNSTWRSDGRNASYDYSGYNNGYIDMRNAWGVVARYNKAPTITVPGTTTITTTAGSSASKTVEIGADNLTGSITLSSDNSLFKLSTTSLTKAGGSVKITYSPTSAGNHSATITVKSSGATTKTFTVKGVANAAPLAFTEVWNYSEKTSKASWMSDFTNLRNMDFGAGKLYIANTVDGLIHVVKAQTGEKIKDLDMTNVSGGTYNFIDVKYMGGPVVACNLALASKSEPLKVYVWDNDNAQPRVLLETTDFGGFPRIGDCMGIKGNLTDGSIHFACSNAANESSVVYYTITDGVCSKTPTVQPLLAKDGTPIELGITPRAIPNADGKWWVDGSNTYLTLVLADGNHYAEVPAAATNEVRSGNTFDAFEFKGSSYAFMTSFDVPVSGDSQSSLKNGRAVLVDGSNGWTSATKLGEYPTSGMGASRNTNFSSSVVTAVNGDKGVEMWVLISQQGLAYYKHGTAPTYTYEQPTSPTLTVTPTSASFSAQVGATQAKTISVSGANLTGNISLALSGANAGMFALSANSTGSTGGSVTVTYNPTVAGTHTATLTATSGSNQATVTLTGTATTAPAEVDDNVVLKEVWNISQSSGKTSDWLTTGSQVTQDMAFANGKLYVVHRASEEDNKIYVVNAYTGAKTGELNTSSCTVGTYLISSIESVDGKVLACNLAAGASSELRVYKWDSDNAEPSIFLSTTTHADVRAGDAFSVSGNLTNGKLWFAYGDKVYYYIISNGTCSTTPTIINLTKAGKAYDAGSASAANYVTANADGSFWVSGKDRVTARFDASGVWQEEFATSVVSNGAGTAAQFFDFGKKKYAVVANYLNKTATTLAEGSFVLSNVTSGIAEATLVGTYPTAGLGSARNTSFRSTLCTDITSTSVNVWVLFPFQGAAYYKYDAGTVSTNVNNTLALSLKLYHNSETLYITGVEAQQVEIYSVMGQKVAATQYSNEIAIAGLQGMYVVVVRDHTGAMATGKIMIK